MTRTEIITIFTHILLVVKSDGLPSKKMLTSYWSCIEMRAGLLGRRNFDVAYILLVMM
jgi:hypothetical protein